MENEILKAALEYAARGWFVLPLNPISKVADVLLPERLDFDWHTDVKPDAATIRRWFEIEPDLNIGIRLRGSGLTVVDIDDIDRWLAWPKALPMLHVPCVKTRRGQHYFFVAGENDPCGAINDDEGVCVGDCLTPYPPDWKPRNRAYVVAPPSRHPMGGEYAWVITPDDGEWISLPDWIRNSVYRPVPPSSWWETDDEFFDDEERVPDCPICGGEFWDGGTSCTCIDWGEGDEEPYPEDLDE